MAIPTSASSRKQALEELEALEGSEQPGAYRDRLRAILKSREPWDLKINALDRIRAMKEPPYELMPEVCSVMCDENVPPELRIRAVHIIRDFALEQKGKTGRLPSYRGAIFVARMKELVGLPMHPILQKRIVRALEEIGPMEAGGS